MAQLLHDDFRYHVMRLADLVHDMVTALFQHPPEADEHLTDPTLRRAAAQHRPLSQRVTRQPAGRVAPYQPRLLGANRHRSHPARPGARPHDPHRAGRRPATLRRSP